MVKVSDCTCCDCDSAQEKEQIKERALSSINKVYTFDNRTFWPDGTGMVTLPLPTQKQLNTLDEVEDLTDQVAKNTQNIGTNAELIAGEQTQIDSLKTTLETSYQAIVQKGSANGYAGLDNNARVPLAQLYAGTSANQVPLIGKQLLANEMLVVDADGLTVRSKPIVQTLSFRGIYPSKAALPTEGNVSGDYAIVSDGTAQDDTGYYVWGYNTGTNEYEWVWTILFDANSYQLISNLVTEISSDSDDSHYPSAKAVKDYHDASIGTVEQEIDTINNDVAEIQQTVDTHTSEIATHTTEITAVNTLANRAYDDVEITNNVMTFTRGNGGTTQIDMPASSKSAIIIPPLRVNISNVTFDYISSPTMKIKQFSTSSFYPTIVSLFGGFSDYKNNPAFIEYFTMTKLNESSTTYTSYRCHIITNDEATDWASQIITQLKTYIDFSSFNISNMTINCRPYVSTGGSIFYASDTSSTSLGSYALVINYDITNDTFTVTNNGFLASEYGTEASCLIFMINVP